MASVFPKVPTISHRAAVCALAVIVLANAGLSAANAVTRLPWWDEGIAVSSPYNLANHGVFGTINMVHETATFNLPFVMSL